jgi:hypothetical protein
MMSQLDKEEDDEELYVLCFVNARILQLIVFDAVNYPAMPWKLYKGSTAKTTLARNNLKS